MTEMHDVVEMLLNRMKDYPEDFVRDPDQGFKEYRSATKWERALGIVYEVAAPHEKDALDIRGEEAKRAVYMGAALATMMGDDEPDEDGVKLKTANRYSFPSAPVKPEGGMIGYNTVSNSLNIGSAQLTADKVNLITELQAKQKAMEEQMKRQIRNEYQKSYATNNA